MGGQVKNGRRSHKLAEHGFLGLKGRENLRRSRGLSPRRRTISSPSKRAPGKGLKLNPGGHQRRPGGDSSTTAARDVGKLSSSLPPRDAGAGRPAARLRAWASCSGSATASVS